MRELRAGDYLLSPGRTCENHWHPPTPVPRTIPFGEGLAANLAASRRSHRRLTGVAGSVMGACFGLGRARLCYRPKAFCICWRTWVRRLTSPPPTSAVAQPAKPISSSALRTSAHGRSSSSLVISRPFLAGAAVALDVHLHAAAAEGADPVARLAVLPVVADVVVHPDPGAVEAVHELDELARASAPAACRRRTSSCSRRSRPGSSGPATPPRE